MSDGFWYSEDAEEEFDLGAGNVGEIGGDSDWFDSSTGGINTSGGNSSGYIPFDPKDPDGKTGGGDNGTGTEMGGGTNSEGGSGNSIPPPRIDVIEAESTSTTATVYTDPHDFVPGSTINVYGTPYPELNGIHTVASVTLNTITYTLDSAFNLSQTILPSPGVADAWRRPDDSGDSGQSGDPVMGDDWDANNDGSGYNGEPGTGEDDGDGWSGNNPGFENDNEWGRGGNDTEGGTYGDEIYDDCVELDVCIDSNGIITFKRKSDGKEFRVGQVNSDDTVSVTNTQFSEAFFTNPQFQLGLPRTLQAGQSLLDSQVDGSVSDADGTVTIYGNGTTFQVPRPSTSFTNMLGLVADPVGPWVFAFPSAGTDGHNVFYGGIGATTVGYRNVQNIGTFNGSVWSTASHTSGTNALLGVDITGAVTVVPLPTSGPVIVNWSAAAFGTSTAARAGNSGIALWFKSPAFPAAVSRFYFWDGTTWYDYGNALTTASAGVTSHLTRSVVDSGNFYFWVDDRSYNRLDLTTGVLYTYPNILPSNAYSGGITANAGVVAMYGLQDNGASPDTGAMWITFGSGVQTLEIPTSNSMIVVPNQGGNAAGFLYRYDGPTIDPTLDYLA